MSLMIILAMFWTFCIAESADASGSMLKSIIELIIELIIIKESNDCFVIFKN